MDDEYEEGGLFSPPWMLEYAMYHVIHNAPDNAWLGVRKLIEYMTDEDEDEELDSHVALDILARYSLTGWHPRDRVETEEEEPRLTEEDIEAEVRRFREMFNVDEEDENG